MISILDHQFLYFTFQTQGRGIKGIHAQSEGTCIYHITAHIVVHNIKVWAILCTLIVFNLYVNANIIMCSSLTK